MVTSPQKLTNMPSSMRQNSDITLEGKAYTNQTVVMVQWAWFTIPAFFGVLSLAFFITTVIHQHRHGTVAWKSSSIAVALAVSDEVRNAMKGSRTTSEFEDRAEDIVVRLEKDPDLGWQLAPLNLERSKVKSITSESQWTMI